MPRINLLPWREAERTRKRQEFFVGIAGALIIALLLGLAINVQMEGQISSQHERNQLIREQIAEVDKQITKILDLEDQKQKLQARIEVIEQLQSSRPMVVHMFDQLVRTLPDGIHLTSVKQVGPQLTLTGVAQSYSRVATFLRNIEASEYLTDPGPGPITSTAAGSEFSVTARQAGQSTDEVSTTRKGGPQPGKRAGVTP